MRNPPKGLFSLKFSRWSAVCLLVFLTALSATGYSQSFVSGYSSKDPLQPGLVVALSKGSKTSVEPVPGGQSGRIYGVVVDPADATATVAEKGKNIFVATSGSYPVLVSVENGAIEAGDYLSISATDGIAAKADGEQSQIVGRALEGYDGSGNVITQTADGSAIGRIAADIAPGKNPLRNETLVPGPLRRAAEAIAGKTVSAVRLYGALAVFAATAVTAGAVLWVGIRSSIISIGRNPLSRGAAYKSLAQVIIMSVIVFAVGVIGVYLLLKI